MSDTAIPVRGWKIRRDAARKRMADDAKRAEIRQIRARIIAGTYVPPEAAEAPEPAEAPAVEPPAPAEPHAVEPPAPSETAERAGAPADAQGGPETPEAGEPGQDAVAGQYGSQGGQETPPEASPLDAWSEEELGAFIEQHGGRFDRRWGKLRLLEEAKRFA